MLWRRLSIAEDIPGYFVQVEEIKHMPFDFLVSGHVARIGTKARRRISERFHERPEERGSSRFEHDKSLQRNGPSG